MSPQRNGNQTSSSGISYQAKLQKPASLSLARIVTVSHAKLNLRLEAEAATKRSGASEAGKPSEHKSFLRDWFPEKKLLLRQHLRSRSSIFQIHIFLSIYNALLDALLMIVLSCSNSGQKLEIYLPGQFAKCIEDALISANPAWNLQENYDSTTILLLTFSFITEKCLQNSATGKGGVPYCGGHRTGYLTWNSGFWLWIKYLH
jgi:hypothetical protein